MDAAALYEFLERFDQSYAQIKTTQKSFRFEDFSLALAKHGGIGGSGVGKHEGAFFRLNRTIQHLLLDEFQDTSPIQLRFVQSLSAEKLFVVGDEKQSIYKFRGADPSIFLDFKTHFKSSESLQLNENFRSQKYIVMLANHEVKLSKEILSNYRKATLRKKSKPLCCIETREFDPVISLQKLEEKGFYFPGCTILVRTNFLKNRLLNVSKGPVFTIHASKGLEFDHVLVFGGNQYIIPHRWGDTEEEIRLLYVAIPRARESLTFLANDFKGHHSSYLPFLSKYCLVRYV